MRIIKTCLLLVFGFICHPLSAAETEMVWADVTISPAGRITEIEIDESAHPSLKSLIMRDYDTWKFEPATRDDIKVRSSSGMQVFFEYSDDPVKGFHIEVSDYQLHARPVEIVNPGYPSKALKDRIEGEVELGFTVNFRGNVKKVKVLRSEPPGVFDKAAIKAIKQWKFKPRKLDDKETHSEETQVIKFRLDNQDNVS